MTHNSSVVRFYTRQTKRLTDNKPDALSSSRWIVHLYYENGHYSKIKVSEHLHISSLMGTLNVDDYKRESPLKGIAL